MSEAYRVIIKSDRRNCYIGETYSGKRYKIIKNEYINCRVGDDFYFYAKKEKGLMKDKLIPISDEMAGVK